MELAHTNAVDFLYLSWLALLQTTLSKMSVGPIERLGSEKLPEGVSSKGSKMSPGMFQYLCTINGSSKMLLNLPILYLHKLHKKLLLKHFDFNFYGNLIF